MQHKLYRLPDGTKCSLPEHVDPPPGALYLYRAQFSHDVAMARLHELARTGVQERREELMRTPGGNAALRLLDAELATLMRCLVS